MTLPDFPIRTRLIPYDDLGIQEVSPNLLSLQNDVDIVLAALMAMGQHGSQMLQADNKGNLRVGAGVTGDKFGDYRKITLIDTITITDNSHTYDLDLSSYSYVNLLPLGKNWGDNDNSLAIQLQALNNHGDMFSIGSINISHNNPANFQYYIAGSTPYIFTDTIRINPTIAGTTPSVDFYLDAFVI